MGSSTSAHAVQPDARLDGKVAIVTGPTSGIGVITAEELVKKGCHVVMFARSKEKMAQTTKAIRASIEKNGDPSKSGQITEIECDLSSLSNVENAANQFKALNLPLHYLVNNAGLMALPYGLTVDGFDTQVGTNHLAHFHLTNLLLPILKSSSPSRIVNVSSDAHKLSNLTIEKLKSVFYPTPKEYSNWTYYGHSKLANILHARHLANQLKDTGVTAYSLHPGVVHTNLGANNGLAGVFYAVAGPIFMKNNSQGAATTMTCLLQPDIEKLSGRYFADCKVSKPTSRGVDDALASALWDFSTNAIADWKAKQQSSSSSSSSSS